MENVNKEHFQGRKKAEALSSLATLKMPVCSELKELLSL